jgi:hypothetical protein
VISVANSTYALSHLLTLLGKAKELDHLGTGTKPNYGVSFRVGEA